TTKILSLTAWASPLRRIHLCSPSLQKIHHSRWEQSQQDIEYDRNYSRSVDQNRCSGTLFISLLIVHGQDEFKVITNTDDRVDHGDDHQGKVTHRNRLAEQNEFRKETSENRYSGHG